MHLFDSQYFVITADSHDRDCLSEPVWKCESNINRGARDSGNLDQYPDGRDFLQNDGQESIMTVMEENFAEYTCRK